MESGNLCARLTAKRLVVWMLLLIYCTDSVVAGCEPTLVDYVVLKAGCNYKTVQTHECSGYCPSRTYPRVIVTNNSQRDEQALGTTELRNLLVTESCCCTITNQIFKKVELTCMEGIVDTEGEYIDATECGEASCESH